MTRVRQFNLGPADGVLARSIPYWRFFRLRPVAWAGFVLLGLLALGAEILGIGLVIPLLSLMDASASSNQAVLANVPLLQSATEWILSKPPQQRLLMLAGIVAVLGLFRSCVGFSKSYLFSWTFAQMSRDLHRRCYERFLGLPVAQVLLGDTSGFTNTIVSFPREASIAVLAIAQMAVGLISGAIILALILLVSWKVGLVVVALSAAIAAVVWILLIRRISDLGGEINDRGVTFYGWIIESVRGRVAIDGLGMQPLAIRRMNELAGLFLSSTLHRECLRTLVDPLLTFLSFILIAALFAVAAQDASAISVRLGESIILILCLTRLLGPMSTVNTALSDLQTYKNSADRVDEFLTWRQDDSDAGREFPGLGRSLEFRNVSFCYAERTESALESISFTLPRNAMVALVGRSGAGKTTIVNLAMRFFDASAGEILGDGADIRGFSRASWRRKISYVSQDSFLFDDTIENNIKSGFEASADAVRDAARKAHAIDFILQTPSGFSTKVGENGVRLSGGQKQRIAIARAVLRQPDILILDEATSNLDGVSEHAIREALSELRRTCAVLVVAHRISTVMDADLILVMDKGRIVERGTHAELLSSSELYQRIVELQNIDALSG